MQLLRLDRRRHFVADHPVLHMLRREVPDCPWVTYFHLAHQRWVVGCWANKDKGKIREYASWDGRDPNRPLIKKVLARAWYASTSPLRAEHVIRNYQEAKAAELRENLDYMEAYQDVKRFTRKNAKGIAGERCHALQD